MNPIHETEDQGVWVSNDKLDSFMKLSGELIVMKNYFHILSKDTDSANLLRKLSDFSYTLNKITDHLQEQIMSVRKVSLDHAFAALTQEARMTLIGCELGVDKNISKLLEQTTAQFIRTREGPFTLSASENRGVTQVTITDPSRGIQTEDTAWLDEVRSSIQTSGGKIKFESPNETSTTLVIDIPVPKTVMVEQTIVARSGVHIIAVPLTAISRIASCNELVASEVNGVRVCQYDNKTVPTRTYAELIAGCNIETNESMHNKSIILIQHKNHTFGLVVDKIEDQLEAVIRPFDAMVKELPGFRGTTILGNEDIAYIISPERMISFALKIAEAA